MRGDARVSPIAFCVPHNVHFLLPFRNAGGTPCCSGCPASLVPSSLSFATEIDLGKSRRETLEAVVILCRKSTRAVAGNKRVAHLPHSSLGRRQPSLHAYRGQMFCDDDDLSANILTFALLCFRRRVVALLDWAIGSIIQIVHSTRTPGLGRGDGKQEKTSKTSSPSRRQRRRLDYNPIRAERSGCGLGPQSGSGDEGIRAAQHVDAFRNQKIVCSSFSSRFR